MLQKNKEIVRQIVQQEVVALHHRIGHRLFGRTNKSCLNLESGLMNSNVYEEINDYNTPSNGIIGRYGDELQLALDRITKLEKEVKTLQEVNKTLSKKTAVKKATIKKTVIKKATIKRK